MTSKEKLEALNYTWFYEPTCQEDADKREAIIKELETDLKLLEKYKRVMCEPIKDIMKDLERLECIENVLDNIANRLKLEAKNIFTLEAEIFNRLEILEILKPFLKKVLEINEDGTEVFFKAVRYFNGYIEDINGNWNETEQIKKNKKLKAWLDA